MPGMRKVLKGELLSKSSGILKKEPSGLRIKTDAAVKCTKGKEA